MKSLYRVIRQKVAHYDFVMQVSVNPELPNAYGFEMSMHSVLSLFDREQVGVIKVDRHLEYAPLHSQDEKENIKRAFLDSHQIMMGDYGMGNSASEIEIDGLLTYMGEGNKFLKRA